MPNINRNIIDCEVIKLKEIEISFQDLLSLFVRKFKWIVIFTALCMIAATLFTLLLITPKYTASTSMLATSYSDKAGSDVSNTELQASRSLIQSYAKIAKSNRVLNPVRSLIDEDITIGQLKSMISLQTTSDTQIIVAQVESTSPELSAQIANALAQVLPVEIAKMDIGGKIDVIDYAEIPTSQSSPNLLMNIIIAAFVGALASYAFFFVAELLDTIVRDEEDLTDTFTNIPILGTVPPLIEIAPAAKGGTDK